MGLPILSALGGIVTGFAAEEPTSHALTVPTFGPELLIMIALGVSTGYALFIVTRYLPGLHDGTDPRDVTTLAASALHRRG